MAAGVIEVEDAGVPPTKLQTYPVALAEEVLVNCATKGAQPLLLETVNVAVGACTICTLWVEVVVPQALVAVSTTV